MAVPYVSSKQLLQLIYYERYHELEMARLADYAPMNNINIVKLNYLKIPKKHRGPRV